MSVSTQYNIIKDERILNLLKRDAFYKGTNAILSNYPGILQTTTIPNPGAEINSIVATIKKKKTSCINFKFIEKTQFKLTLIGTNGSATGKQYFYYGEIPDLYEVLDGEPVIIEFCINELKVKDQEKEIEKGGYKIEGLFDVGGNRTKQNFFLTK